MDYDGRFIMQKTVDWSLLNDGMTIPVSACAPLKAWDESIISPRSNYVRLLPTGRKNFHRIIHMNVFVKPNDQSKACLCFGMARKRRIQSNNPHFNRNKFQFEFQNGEVLRLRLNENLKVL